MNIVSILSGVTLVVALTLAVEGINWATDGEVYVASLYRLAQLEGSQLPPPPPGGGAFGPPPTGSFQPPSGGTSGSFQPSGGYPPPPGGGFPQQPGGAFGPPPSGGFQQPGSGAPPGAIPGQQPGGFQSGQQFPGGGATQEQFPGKGATEGQFPSSRGHESFPASEKFSPGGEFPGEAEGEFEEPQLVSPWEKQQVLREIKDIKRRVTSLVRKAAKISGDAAQSLNQLSAELDGYQRVLSDPNGDEEAQREAIDDFRNSQPWDLVNGIEIRLRLPQELKQIENSIKLTLKTLNAKVVANVGLNVEQLRSVLSQMQQQAAEIRGLINTDPEEAQAGIQEFHQGTHPNEIQSAVNAAVNLSKRVREVGRNANLKARLQSYLEQMVSAINSGDYEVHDIMREAEQLMQQFYQSRSGRR